MAVSAIQFTTNTFENEIVCIPYLYDGSATGYPLSLDIINWKVYEANQLTLQPIIANPLTIPPNDFYMSHFYLEEPLTGLNLVQNQSFYYQLSPQVGSYDTNIHSPITPYLSGGSSIHIFLSSQRFGKLIDITNTSEKSVLSSNYMLNVGTSLVSSILTGLWYDEALLIPTYVLAPVSGILDYFTGRLWVDFSNYPSLCIESNLSTVYIKYSGNYDTSLFTNVPYISASQLYIKIRDKDTKSFYITCASETPNTQGGSFIYNPYSIAIVEDDYDFITASISAVYKTRNSYENLTYNNSLSSNYWPRSMINGRAIVWKSTNTNSNNLSAYSTKAGGGLSAFPISGWSLYLDNIHLSATGSSDTYYLTACFPDDTLNERTSAIYKFNYSVPISETLSIDVRSSTLTSEILQVQRKVATDTGVYYSPVQDSLTWGRVNNSFGYTTLTASSGIAINDYTIQTYLKPYPFLPFTRSTGLLSTVLLYSGTGIVTGYDYVYGYDYLKIEYANNTDTIYMVSAAYASNPNMSAIHTFQIYSAPTNVIISAVQFINQPYTRSLTAQVMNDKGGGIYVPLHTANKIIWDITEPVAGSVQGKSLADDPYTFGDLADSIMVFEISTSKFDMVNTFPILCAFNLQVDVYDTYHSPTTYLVSNNLNFSVDTFPATSIFISKLQINQETSDLVTDMWRVSTLNYPVTAIDRTIINGTSVIEGDRLIDFDGGATSTTAISVVKTFVNKGVYDISLLRTNVSAAGWLSAHSMESHINLHIISQFLPADFMVYPTYVFVTSSIQVTNSLTTPITTNGASAYDVGHTEPFLIAAWDQTL